jgi:hypothetical protein
MLRCSVVGKWTGAAVGAEKGKLIGDYKVLGGGLYGPAKASSACLGPFG